ncbi:MAG: peroxiredoxin-like family protein [Pseudomonadota bacterium]|nr:peroxiredoxin-like family protein [Pseudomonadota bacterium]
MSSFTPLIPRQPVPALSLPTVGGGTWTLAEQKPRHFTMIVFYRGLHCPICSKYLGDLNAKAGQFAEKGVNVFVASGDTKERAAEAAQKWGLDKLTVGYGLSLDKAREWGLFISAGRGKTSIGVEEPALFPEPGLFVITPDRKLYWSSVQTMPFARPSFAEILGAFDFVIAKNYPGRGEVVDHTKAA